MSWHQSITEKIRRINWLRLQKNVHLICVNLCGSMLKRKNVIKITEMKYNLKFPTVNQLWVRRLISWYFHYFRRTLHEAAASISACTFHSIISRYSLTIVFDCNLSIIIISRCGWFCWFAIFFACFLLPYFFAPLVSLKTWNYTCNYKFLTHVNLLFFFFFCFVQSNCHFFFMPHFLQQIRVFVTFFFLRHSIRLCIFFFVLICRYFGTSFTFMLLTTFSLNFSLCFTFWSSIPLVGWSAEEREKKQQIYV